MKFITYIFRFLVGGLFIFSGIVKTIDPIGFSYKLEEYFSENVFNIPFFISFSLLIATIFVILEVILGIFLLLGIFKKFTLYNLLGLIVIFTFLTFYSAYFDKVRSCGCFGDFINLKPWESFYKDLILLILILFIIINRKFINPLFSNIKILNCIAFIGTLITCWIAYQGIFNLPIYDFRPYSEGKSLIQGRKSAEELGLKPPKMVTIYTYLNKKTGEEKIISSLDLMNTNIWEDPNWEINEGKTKSNVIIEEGYQAPIPPDFAIYCEEQDVTEQILNTNKIVIITIIHSKDLGIDTIAKIRKLVSDLKNKQIKSIVISDVSNIYGIKTCNLDDKIIKAINRSNVGVMLLEKGIVKKKYALSNFPQIKEIKNIYNH